MRFSHKKEKNNPRNPRLSNNRAKVFSYTAARSGRDRPLNRGEDRPVPNTDNPNRISKLINMLIIIFVGICMIYLTTMETNSQIKVVGEEVYPREQSSYKAKIDEILKSSVLNKNKLTFDKVGLENQIRQQFPEVNTVEVSIPIMRHRPVVEVSLAKPAARLVTPNKTYILDQQGQALFEESQAASSLDTGSLLTISDSSDHQVSLGKPALTEQQINFINELIGQTTAKNIKPQAFTLSQGGTAVDVRFEGLSYFTKFSFYADARQSSGAFLVLQEQIDSGKITKPQEYADLRVPDKAFIR